MKQYRELKAICAARSGRSSLAGWLARPPMALSAPSGDTPEARSAGTEAKAPSSPSNRHGEREQPQSSRRSR